MLIDKELFGYFSVCATLLRFGFYFHSLFKGQAKPHVFSWVTWGILTSIDFYAQYSNQAGPGAWSTGLIALLCFSTAIMALFRGERDITRSDWGVFICALTIIPVWYLTKDALLAVIMTIVINIMGAYYPTFRKSYYRPYEEPLLLYVIGLFQVALSLLAIEHYYLVNVIYPAAVITANASFTAMVLWRRNKMSGAAFA